VWDESVVVQTCLNDFGVGRGSDVECAAIKVRYLNIISTKSFFKWNLLLNEQIIALKALK
jgi:hypothetical protein